MINNVTYEIYSCKTGLTIYAIKSPKCDKKRALIILFILVFSSLPPVVNIHHIMRCFTLVATVISVSCVEIIKPESNNWEKHSRKVGVKSEPKIERRVAQQNGYGAPQGGYGAPEEEVVDLHNKEFCVDVSTFQEVVWVEREGQMCKTNFVKQCSPKSQNVCADVTETSCEVSNMTKNCFFLDKISIRTREILLP